MAKKPKPEAADGAPKKRSAKVASPTHWSWRRPPAAPDAEASAETGQEPAEA